MHRYFCCDGLHHQWMHIVIPRLCVLQVWDSLTGKMRKDLQYQADEQFMMHETAVLSVAMSLTSELLASGSQDGKVKVWS